MDADEFLGLSTLSTTVAVVALPPQSTEHGGRRMRRIDQIERPPPPSHPNYGSPTYTLVRVAKGDHEGKVGWIYGVLHEWAGTYAMRGVHLSAAPPPFCKRESSVILDPPIIEVPQGHLTAIDWPTYASEIDRQSTETGNVRT
jgi:hypothetical protein